MSLSKIVPLRFYFNKLSNKIKETSSYDNIKNKISQLTEKRFLFTTNLNSFNNILKSKGFAKHFYSQKIMLESYIKDGSWKKDFDFRLWDKMKKLKVFLYLFGFAYAILFVRRYFGKSKEKQEIEMYKFTESLKEQNNKIIQNTESLKYMLAKEDKYNESFKNSSFKVLFQ